jgi:acyl-CoA synthetase (AMP-forming)/AMP-acid ligase II
MISGDELLENPTAVGRTVPTHEIEIRDDAGQPVPEGVEGEIFIRSPYVMLEYWRKPEASRETS